MEQMVDFRLESYKSISLKLGTSDLKKLGFLVLQEVLNSKSEIEEAKESIKKVIYLENRVIPLLFRDYSNDDITVLLATFLEDKEVLEKFFKGFSKIRTNMLKDDMEYFIKKGIERKEKLRVMLKFIETLTKMEESGEIKYVMKRVRFTDLKDKSYRRLGTTKDEYIVTMLKNIDMKDFEVFLWALGRLQEKELADKLFKSLSKRASELVEEEMKYLAEPFEEEVLSAINRIFETVEELRKKGEFNYG